MRPNGAVGSDEGPSRIITWEGFANARDLGGLPSQNGRVTRFGAYIRSADMRFVVEAGWQMAREAGIRTIIDLRNESEIRPGAIQRLEGSAPFPAPSAAAAPPSWLSRVEVALDDISDTAFWQFLSRERIDGSGGVHRFVDDRGDGIHRHPGAAHAGALARGAQS